MIIYGLFCHKDEKGITGFEASKGIQRISLLKSVKFTFKYFFLFQSQCGKTFDGKTFSVVPNSRRQKVCEGSQITSTIQLLPSSWGWREQLVIFGYFHYININSNYFQQLRFSNSSLNCFLKI